MQVAIDYLVMFTHTFNRMNQKDISSYRDISVLIVWWFSYCEIIRFNLLRRSHIKGLSRLQFIHLSYLLLVWMI